MEVVGGDWCLDWPLLKVVGKSERMEGGTNKGVVLICLRFPMCERDCDDVCKQIYRIWFKFK